MASLADGLANRRGPYSIHELSDSQKAHFTATLEYLTGERVIFIAQNEYSAQKAYEDFSALYGRDAVFMPSREIMLYDVEAKDYEVAFRRVSALDRMLSGDFAVAVMSVETAVQFVPPPELFRAMTREFKTGGRLDLQSVNADLIGMGYERVATVEARGTFAVRGGILDVYPVDQEYAFRVELFDDEIDSIRQFDVQTQRAVGAMGENGGAYTGGTSGGVNAGWASGGAYAGGTSGGVNAGGTSGGVNAGGGFVKILPARDILYRESDLDGIIARILASPKAGQRAAVAEDVEKFRASRYFAGMDRYLAFMYEKDDTPLSYANDCIFVFDEPVRAFQKLQSAEQEHAQICELLIERGKLLQEASRFQLDFYELANVIPSRRRVALSAIRSAREAELLGPQKPATISGKSAVSYQGNVELLKTDVRERLRDKWTVIILTKSAVKAERLMESLGADSIPVTRVGHVLGGAGGSGADVSHASGSSAGSVGAARAVPGVVSICYGGLTAGFEYPKIKLIVICDTEFQGASRATRRIKKAHQGEKISFFTDLRIGDFVVHQTHGIGVFSGLEQMKIDDAIRDYLKIRYKDGDILYIPTNQLDLVQKYVGSDARAPKVNSLNSMDWSRTKRRVKESLKTLAAELILVYAKRREAAGFAFSPDTPWQRQFEEQFPFSETDDQLRSIEEIKADMESPRLMDRLLCGDVGFGKTEVAIRAAFKAVSDGKQVAFLVPTTVLAQQHHQTFTDRFSEFPVSVDVLSRFRTAGEQKGVASALSEGKLDIVIGTHKLLNKNIKFKNLGLLVVDEEQRFGVNQKERIKAIKPDVDVLSLSATPIPRTLHMSMTKIRDISVLKDPPEERFPVQTFVMEYDGDVIREAILREVAREGQVFYLYNRVMGIDIKTMQPRASLPESVRIAYAHGQMNDRELEDIMIAFVNRRYDVLVCTTIIESGLDIPNVNTIVVEDADRMGLAQLYQLRGRVGRSNRLAYAYITHKRDKVITDESEKRLAAIREFAELGSGFRIAMRDMEIRGVGNLLGTEQHGHMESVGYDMYCRLLDEAVRELEAAGEAAGGAGSAGVRAGTAGGVGVSARADVNAAGGAGARAGVNAAGGAGVRVGVNAVGGAGAGARFGVNAVSGVGVSARAGVNAAGANVNRMNAAPSPPVKAAGTRVASAGGRPPVGAQESGIDRVAQVNLEIHINAYIDSLYIDDETLRLEMYQKIAGARSEEDIFDITDEMLDRYSSMPPETENLMRLTRVKILAAACGISSVAEKNGQVTMQIAPNGVFNIEKLSEVSRKYRGQVLFSAGASPHLIFRPLARTAPPRRAESRSIELAPPAAPTIEGAVDAVIRFLGDLSA